MKLGCAIVTCVYGIKKSIIIVLRLCIPDNMRKRRIVDRDKTGLKDSS
jgi:hypothetical protein